METAVACQLLCCVSITSSEVKVALGGDGGDELFSGYSRYWVKSEVRRQSFFCAKENLKAYLSFGLLFLVLVLVKYLTKIALKNFYPHCLQTYSHLLTLNNR